MEVTGTGIEDLLIIKPDVYGDERGYFLETFNARTFSEVTGKKYDFVQDNESKSRYGVVRGLHYQIEPHSQSKLVRVISGEVYDVAVDLRPHSPTCGQWKGVRLSSDNKLQFLIPSGFAHGFSVLSETAVFSYKCDSFYHPNSERGICYADPVLNIDWGIDEKDIVVSDKDKAWPSFKEAEVNF